MNGEGASRRAHFLVRCCYLITAEFGSLRRIPNIAIEGPIGVGKSSFACWLSAHLCAELLLELPHENPYLGRFCADMPGYAFQTQLYFRCQRLTQRRSKTPPDTFAGDVVRDVLFATDALFAPMNLSDDGFRRYSRMRAQLAPAVSEPNLVIWLQAAPETPLHGHPLARYRH